MNTKSSQPSPVGVEPKQLLLDGGMVDESKLPRAKGVPRVRQADRKQVIMHTAALDDLLGADHQARLVWSYVQELNLQPLYDQVTVSVGGVGRSATDPKILLALWLYATLDGVGSARQLARLCQDHVAYQWICGTVSMNYHTLSDFRTGHTDFLDDLLTTSVATLVHQGLVQMNRVALDGMRVRASAGASSFHRVQSLQRCLAEAQQQVETLRGEVQSDGGSSTTRQQAARQRAARERAERLRRALDQLPQVLAKKKARERDQARVSTTDPDARVMKMPDGGFRPAYNVQLAVDTHTQIVTGAAVVNAGSDHGQMVTMVTQHEQRYGHPPDEILADGGFAKKEDIEQVSPPQGSTVVYAPVQEPKDPQRDKYSPLASDSPAVAEWRVRMSTAHAQEIYKERASTAECVNAAARNRGLQRFLVRGLQKVKAVALWYALAHNVARIIALGALT